MALQVRLRNKFFILFFLVFTSCSQTPERIKSSNEDLTKEKGIYYYKDVPYSGILEEYSAADFMVSEILLEEGVRNGLSKFYWPDGTLKCEAMYRNGVYHGAVKRYFEDGTLFSWFNYDKGHESGRQQMWKSDGRIKVNYEVINGRKYGLTGVKNCVNVLEKDSHSF